MRSVICMCVIAVVLAGCGYPALMTPGSAARTVGGWEGTTSQGMPISFVVAPNETITAIAIGYDFNNCSELLVFSELSLPTISDVTCIPGPCSVTLNSYRSFTHQVGSPVGGLRTQINGLFLPRNQAQGQAVFSHPDCGTATVQWTATRR